MIKNTLEFNGGVECLSNGISNPVTILIGGVYHG